MALSSEDVRKQTAVILKQKGINTPNLDLIFFSDGMNPQIIAELYAFKQVKEINNQNFSASFTDSDLMKIYGNLLKTNVTFFSDNAKRELIYTLFRYNKIWR